MNNEYPIPKIYYYTQQLYIIVMFTKPETGFIIDLNVNGSALVYDCDNKLKVPHFGLYSETWTEEKFTEIKVNENNLSSS